MGLVEEKSQLDRQSARAGRNRRPVAPSSTNLARQSGDGPSGPRFVSKRYANLQGENERRRETRSPRTCRAPAPANPGPDHHLLDRPGPSGRAARRCSADDRISPRRERRRPRRNLGTSVDGRRFVRACENRLFGADFRRGVRRPLADMRVAVADMQAATQKTASRPVLSNSEEGNPIAPGARS